MRLFKRAENAVIQEATGAGQTLRLAAAAMLTLIGVLVGAVLVGVVLTARG